MSGTGPSIVLFPGLGADARLFREQQARFPNLTVVSWIEPRGPESLADYAARMASSDVSELHPSYIGGASFGGMVALEVAKLLRPRGVFLLGSCRSPRSIAGIFRFGSRFACVLPVSLLRRGDLFAPPVARVMGSRSREIANLVAEMYRSISPSLIRWGAGAIRNWAGLEDPGVPVHHIHGQSDRVIPLRGVRPDRVVPGAGHLLTLTHAEAVNAFLVEKTVRAD
jgi:pimeloyl-ACP methyl ester carboxylesterase